MPSANESDILIEIRKNPNMTRAKLIKKLPHLSSSTIYRLINKLKSENRVFENSFNELTTKTDDLQTFKFHPLIQSRKSVDAISNCFYYSPELLKEIIMPFIPEYGERMGKVFVDLFYLFQAVADVHADGNDEVEKPNVEELTKEIQTLLKEITPQNQG